MKLKYEIEFDIKTDNLIAARQKNNLIMRYLNKLLADCIHTGEVKLITSLKSISPHSLEGCYELTEVSEDV